MRRWMYFSVFVHKSAVFLSVIIYSATQSKGQLYNPVLSVQSLFYHCLLHLFLISNVIFLCSKFYFILLLFFLIIIAGFI